MLFRSTQTKRSKTSQKRQRTKNRLNTILNATICTRRKLHWAATGCADISGCYHDADANCRKHLFCAGGSPPARSTGEAENGNSAPEQAGPHTLICTTASYCTVWWCRPDKFILGGFSMNYHPSTRPTRARPSGSALAFSSPSPSARSFSSPLRSAPL